MSKLIFLFPELESEAFSLSLSRTLPKEIPSSTKVERPRRNDRTASSRLLSSSTGSDVLNPPSTSRKPPSNRPFEGEKTGALEEVMQNLPDPSPFIGSGKDVNPPPLSVEMPQVNGEGMSSHDLDGKQHGGQSEGVMDVERRKVCILSIDGGGMRGIIPGRILACLEESLQRKSGNPDARIADFFDVAAGTSVGGILITMLFTSDGHGRPLFNGEQTWKLVAEKGRKIFKVPKFQRPLSKFRGMFSPRYSSRNLEKILKEYLVREGRALTLRDTIKPVLIPCYDLTSAGPFLFSRADALDAESWDFRLWEVCRATSAVPAFFKPAHITSVDGKTICTGVDGGLVMNNPTAAAITHVLHNKREFPSVRGVDDLLVLSLGTGQFDRTYKYQKVRQWGAFQWVKPIVKIVLDGISDMVDHTISVSFGHQSRANYVRLQVSGLPDRCLTAMDDPSQTNVQRLMKMSDELLLQRGMEHLPFGGRRLLSQTNSERLDWFAEQLVQEHKLRSRQDMTRSVM